MFEDVVRVANTYWTQFLYVLPRLVAAAILMAVVWVGAARLRSWLPLRYPRTPMTPCWLTF